MKFAIKTEVIESLGLSPELKEREFEGVQRPTFGEVAHAERLLKKKADDWSSFDSARFEAWLAVRHVDHKWLPWDAMDAMSPVDIVEVKDPDPDPDPDPSPDPQD